MPRQHTRGQRPQGRRFAPARRGYSARPPIRRQNKGLNVHYSKFINKAEIPREEARFVPTHTFADFAVDERLKKNIAHKGYEHPTPIQDKTIPLSLAGRDVVGLAETGTGKTGAFLIPLINKVLKNPQENVLIMAPTRELAVQIEEEFRTFARNLPVHAALAIGGANINMQIKSLRRGAQFLIGTPGRITDLMDRGEIKLGKCRNLVLDEADRMLDMGFIDAVRTILATMPKERQTLFFSATLSREIEALIHEFLNNPERVSVKKGDTSRMVDQDVVHIDRDRTKFDHLMDLLKHRDFSKVLVFGRTKHGVEKLFTHLKGAGIKVESIHGNKSHGQRQRALQAFKDERVQVLVATDVAARGLDIPNVTHVINFELPNTYEEYVHRIGRTGRAGAQGKALTFIESR